MSNTQITDEERRAAREAELRARRDRLAQGFLSVAQQESRALARAQKEEKERRGARGALVETAGLSELSDRELLGGLLLLADILREPSLLYDASSGLGLAEQRTRARERWAMEGQRKEDEGRPPTKVAAIVTFGYALTADEKRRVQQTGLRWNAIRGEWGGRVVAETVRGLVSTLGGQIDFLPEVGAPSTARASVVEDDEVN